MTFGAFAEIVPGVDGLIHISQIANRRIGKPDEVLAVGDIVDVKITAIDEDKHKVSLSIRALSEPAPAPERRSRPEREDKPRARATPWSMRSARPARAAASSPRSPSTRTEFLPKSPRHTAGRLISSGKNLID